MGKLFKWGKVNAFVVKKLRIVEVAEVNQD